MSNSSHKLLFAIFSFFFFLTGCGGNASNTLALASHPSGVLIQLPRECLGNLTDKPEMREFCTHLAEVEANRAMDAGREASKAIAAENARKTEDDKRRANNPCPNWFFAAPECYNSQGIFDGGRENGVGERLLQQKRQQIEIERLELERARIRAEKERLERREKENNDRKQ